MSGTGPIVAIERCGSYDEAEVAAALDAALGSLGGMGAFVSPGASVFLMTPNEQKFAVWRVRLECHGVPPGTSHQITVTVNATVAQPPDGPAGHPDTNPANDSKSAIKVVTIQ